MLQILHVLELPLQCAKYDFSLMNRQILVKVQTVMIVDPIWRQAERYNDTP